MDLDGHKSSRCGNMLVCECVCRDAEVLLLLLLLSHTVCSVIFLECLSGFTHQKEQLGTGTVISIIKSKLRFNNKVNLRGRLIGLRSWCLNQWPSH